MDNTTFHTSSCWTDSIPPLLVRLLAPFTTELAFASSRLVAHTTLARHRKLTDQTANTRRQRLVQLGLLRARRVLEDFLSLGLLELELFALVLVVCEFL